MSVDEGKSEKIEVSFDKWTFTVAVPDVLTSGTHEKVFITGNIPELGEWDYKRLVPLEQEKKSIIWHKTIMIPNNCVVYYRYVIGMVINEANNEIAVTRWETKLNPREVTETMLCPSTDVFGDFNGKQRVLRGWLTCQTLLQFKFTNNPLKLKSRMSERNISIKITPVKLFFSSDPNADESSVSADGLESDVQSKVTVHVATLDNDPGLCRLHSQEQFGREYRPNDILLFNILATDIKALAYLIDFYAYSSRAAPKDAPCHIGYTYVLPNMFKPSEGSLELPVTCNVKHRPLGTVHIQYLIVHPMAENLCDLKVSYTKYWDPTWTGLEVGHRGLGASFKTKGNLIRENTVASLKKAAASGADLLEFDVQLSKDMVPVIYHDYYVCISMKRKKEIAFSEMLELPVKDLTLEHLQNLKVYHLVEGRSNELLFDDEDLEEHQPFPTLEVLLQNIDMHVGFNVELKWNMELADGTFELHNPFDMNLYVDKVLEVILKHAGDRRIVFSCFNPDICTMVRNKQNRYPVMFLTQGVTCKYKPYRDPRCASIPSAVQSAVSTEILGVVVHTEDLLRDPTQVKLATDAGLVIFCWGDDNNDKTTIKKMKEMGLHAVIYDKLDEYSTKEIKESIFLMKARESQQLVLEALEQPPSSSSLGDSGSSGEPGSSSDSVVSVPPPPPPRPYLDMAVRYKLQEENRSTITSLESLASSIDPRDQNSDKSLKRNVELIAPCDKERQVKEETTSFQGVIPPGYDKNCPKKYRKNST